MVEEDRCFRRRLTQCFRTQVPPPSDLQATNKVLMIASHAYLSCAIIAEDIPWPHSKPRSALELAAYLPLMSESEAQRTCPGFPPKASPNR
jgi:hypothetical protein